MAPSNSYEATDNSRGREELEDHQKQLQDLQQYVQQRQEAEPVESEVNHEPTIHDKPAEEIKYETGGDDDDDDDKHDSKHGGVTQLLASAVPTVLEGVLNVASKTSDMLGINNSSTEEFDLANNGRSATLPTSASENKHKTLDSSLAPTNHSNPDLMTMESFQMNGGSVINSAGHDSVEHSHHLNKDSSGNFPEPFHNTQPYDQTDSVGSYDHEANQTTTDDDDDNDSSSINLSYANEKRFQEFHALFRSVPEEEKLIEDYGCALQKEILVQGRLYISEDHICFNANIFGWVTNLVIAFSEITAIEKRLTAFVIPNAISITTTNNTKGHFFASFLSRDSAFELLMAAWRKSFPCPANASAVENNVYLRNNRSSTTLNGDDDDSDSFMSARPASIISKKGRHRSNSSGGWTPDEAETDGGADFDSKSTQSSHRHSKRSAVRKILKEVIGPGKHDDDSHNDSNVGRVRSFSEAPPPPTSIDHRSRESAGHSPLRAMDGAPATYQSNTGTESTSQASSGGSNSSHAPTTCKCSKDGRHYPTTFLNETYPGTVENMWKLLFESDFNKAFLTSEVMKGADVQEEPWKKNSDGKMGRVTKYTKWIGLPIGPKTTKATLTDVCEHKDFDDYVTDVTTTATPDVPSGGSFTTKVRTCITWAGPNKVKILVTGGVEFTKSSWIKGQIEKGAAEGLTTHYKEFDKSIRKYISEHPEFGGGGALAVGKRSSEARSQANARTDGISNQAGETTSSDVAVEKTTAPPPTAVQATEKSGLLSSITSMLPSIEGDGVSQLGLMVVLAIILLVNIHIWFQISNVTSQIDKVHVDVISGQHDEVGASRSVYKDSRRYPIDGGFTRQQEEAMWAWLTEREERHRQYQRANERDWVDVRKNDEPVKESSTKSEECVSCDNNSENAKTRSEHIDFSLAEERLQAKINDLQHQLEVLEKSLELGTQGM
ncbi:hypothetical protein BGZ49_006692 [Haplosporangium sp. Z 27]|nr:hypothetical protein BGZ49_006692 [Haplosporangium sp. Z 27]